MLTILNRITIVLLLFYGCSVFQTHPETNPVFVPYIIEFEKKSGVKYKGKMDFNKSLKPFGRVGVCNTLTKRVDISYAYWNRITKIQRKALIFHELGHCALNRGHYNRTRTQSDCPISIMHSNTLDDFCLTYYWKQYEKELFDF